MAKPELGTKRQCQACGTKFFDMNRRSPACPKCGTIFQAAPPPPTPRAAARAAPAPVEDEDKGADPENAELVSLEDAEKPDTGDNASDDSDDDNDNAADDTFLEEDEEDGNDVAGLIDGDIETDEEP